MQNPFRNIEDILNYSNEEAEKFLNGEINTEHLLLAILRRNDHTLNHIFNDFGINVNMLKATLDESQRNLSEKKTNHGDQASDTKVLTYDETTNNVIRDSVLEARICKGTYTYVEPEHLLLAILKYKDCAPAKLLITQGLTYDKLMSYIKKNYSQVDKASLTSREKIEAALDKLDSKNLFNEMSAKDDNISDDIVDEDSTGDLLDPEEEPEELNNPVRNFQEPSRNRKTQKSKTPILDNFCYDYTKAAKEGSIDPVVGREHEIYRVLEILGRRKKNNPILIGEPGVGKSAIIEGLAELINNDKNNCFLFGKRLLGLDVTSLIAGTKYRGQFEERIKALLKELEDNPDIIIFIDEIHTIIGAGAAEGTMDVANILKPALARGTIQCIGATTLNEYRKSIEKDGALERRFQKVIVNPTTVDQTIQILRNIKEKYEEHHGVTYTDEALVACVKLSDRYITDRFFPDKAIDIMDEVGSRVHIKNSKMPEGILQLEEQLTNISRKKQEAVSNQNYEMAAECRDRQSEIEAKIEQLKKNAQYGNTGKRTKIEANAVEDVVSLMTGIPVQKMAESETTRLRGMAKRLQEEVIAQDDAINKIVKAIQRNRMGLREPSHPIGTFMFLGPTGVGKTYLAKKLAEELFGSAESLIRIDMSEYSESFNTSRLVGAPPGYVGYDEGGQLTEKVRRKPYSIVLLDEIEKANNKVFNMLLQVLDEGRLTDGNGRLIDFRNTIIIMTSNAGTQRLKEFCRGVGFTANGLSSDKPMDENDKRYARNVIQKSLARQFAPEFLNRMDEIIIFDQLNLDAIKRIVELELKPLVHRIEEQGYKVKITEKAKELIAAKGYDVQFGARPLKRAIQTYIEDRICKILLEEGLSQGDTIVIGKNSQKDELTFKIAHP